MPASGARGGGELKRHFPLVTRNWYLVGLGGGELQEPFCSSPEKGTRPAPYRLGPPLLWPRLSERLLLWLRLLRASLLASSLSSPYK